MLSFVLEMKAEDERLEKLSFDLKVNYTLLPPLTYVETGHLSLLLRFQTGI